MRKFPFYIDHKNSNKMVIIKQSIGIDVSKDKLDVMFKEQSDKGLKIKGSKKFDNTPVGFQLLLEWSNKRIKTENIIFVLEATGVYHEDLLYFLHENNKSVCVELPQRIKYFAKSKGVKTKNDKIDSGVIADYGIERTLKIWQPPSPKFKTLRDLSREHRALNDTKTTALNRLHAAQHAHEKDAGVLARSQAQIEFYNQQIEEVRTDIKSVIKADKKLSKKLQKIETIKGVGLITIVTVIAETGGFYLFNNINQLISYAGLDVIENQSGNHNGKTRISKKGNSNLRTAVYMPALSAIRSDEKMKAFNNRIMETHKYKKQGIVAVMRKLLILIYTLWKKDEEYNQDYEWGTKKEQATAVA
ncbi:MAG: IS110 family transposase [Bacteroidales bacterium]|nr:IS110 family transposase [Bacteroidales bacterium]